MADYPTPRVAYVKILNNPNLIDKIVTGDGIGIRASIITLILINQQGWLIYSIGLPTPPEYINFPVNTTNNYVD